MEERHFTAEEANQMLPLVRRIVNDILRTGRDVRNIAVESENKPAQKELDRLMDQLDELFDELETLGCYYKDWNFSVGLVDFPAVVNGKEVFLCWRSDEKEVQFYHDEESGFAGRRPIPQSSPSIN